MNYNRLILGGYLTRDPEVSYTQSGTARVTFGIASNERVKRSDGDGYDERPCFVDVTIWGKRGEAFARFHKKGKAAFVEGKLRLDQWEDKKTGQKRQKLYMVADAWEFVGQKDTAHVRTMSSEPAPKGKADDDPF